MASARGGLGGADRAADGAPRPRDRRCRPPPADVRAEAGAGHVTLRWEPVPGAIGYLVHRAPGRTGPFERVDHGGRDVLAVPGPYYCDTTGERGRARLVRRRVGRAPMAEPEPGELSEPVEATPARRAGRAARRSRPRRPRRRGASTRSGT